MASDYAYLLSWRRLICTAGLFLRPAATAQTSNRAPQTTGLLTVFLPDSEPLSLEASAVAVNTVGTGLNTDLVTTLHVACPTAASPENDACRAAGIYPAQVYHTQGSVWGGTTTDPGDDSTTTWQCALAGSNPTLGADCVKTVVGALGQFSRVLIGAYDNCYVLAHQRPVVVTAGAEKINWAGHATMDAGQYVSLRSSLLTEAGCPASQTTIWAGTASHVASTSGNGATVSARLSTGTGGTGLGATSPMQADPAAAATSSASSDGASLGWGDPTMAVLFGMGVAVSGMML
ncbi:hypothetical protein C8A03DRAFT_35383 [Achaetomium macrosporum]|uniref:Uncharacterized protein n=1 Tax=Achaetomium macrosporum TaxID=79813 RepID=A0AAN7C781_9PEZI|nr:hypothetical protein C8A03DRAFT_35383 [Achaetomium macrosporum]